MGSKTLALPHTRKVTHIHLFVALGELAGGESEQESRMGSVERPGRAIGAPGGGHLEIPRHVENKSQGGAIVGPSQGIESLVKYEV